MRKRIARNFGEHIKGGFSLLELLVAVAILALTLVPVAYFYNRALQAIESASIRSRALALAQERMNELLSLPYEELRANNKPGPADIEINNLDPTATNIYDHNNFMYHYPLPLGFNPYVPQTQGYDNSYGIVRRNANGYGDPTTSGIPANPHVNIRSLGGSPFYEYEPIGFYLSLPPNDPRRHEALVQGLTEERLESLYSIFGRRTIILDVLPDPIDDDNDPYPVDSPLDGGANVLNPYPPQKGPLDKFVVRSKYGMRGKLITVQVFWLPRRAPQGYLRPDELNMVQLKTFIPASNARGTISTENDLISSNNYLLITPST